MTSRKSPAVIFTPEEGTIDATARCFDHCRARGYDVKGIVRGNWAAVADMVRRGAVTVVVIDQQEHLDPTWEPRIEVAERPSRRHVSTRRGETPAARRRRPRLL